MKDFIERNGFALFTITALATALGLGISLAQSGAVYPTGLEPANEPTMICECVPL